MERIKNDFKEIILKFIEENDFAKPLMIVFTSKYGSSNPSVDNCGEWLKNTFNVFFIRNNPLYGHDYFINYDTIERIEDHPELQNSAVIPEGADKAQLLIYFRMIDQLNPQHLAYAVALSKWLQKPTICLVNDYYYNGLNKEEEKAIILSNFVVLFYEV